MLFLKLALRNMIRNRVRTILNVLMVIGAFSSIVIFRGFAHYMLYAIELSMTEGQTGHLQIASKAVWQADLPKKKETAYIDQPEELEKKLLEIPDVKSASGRANVYVLLVNGDKSVGAMAIGFDPIAEPNVENILYFIDGEHFSKEPKFETLVGAGLAKNLQLKVGQSFTVLAQTLSGSMSSVDVEVRALVKSGLADIDNSAIYIPLTIAQKLLDTKRIERIGIHLKKDVVLEDAFEKVNGVISATGASFGADLMVKTWKETAVIFRQLVQFFGVQNTLVEVILSCLIFFGILNTLGMSIYERIGEIGTLKALGDRNEDVLFQLSLEGLLLGLLGTCIATPFAFIVAHLISMANIMVTMPGASRPIPIKILTLQMDYFTAGIAVCITCLIATLWPAQKAIRLSIVDALRANS